MVVSPHYLASMAGSQILQKGGNAFDAAVAVSAYLAVVYPHATSLSGDSFCSCTTLTTEKSVIITAAAVPIMGFTTAFTTEKFRFRTEGPKARLPFRGWWTVGMQFSRKLLTFADVLEPAIG
jgi:gamma-glutamyltranspeptidase/glutathione hydrolase